MSSLLNCEVVVNMSVNIGSLYNEDKMGGILQLDQTVRLFPSTHFRSAVGVSVRKLNLC